LPADRFFMKQRSPARGKRMQSFIGVFVLFDGRRHLGRLGDCNQAERDRSACKTAKVLKI
jgi:hypothetical protein